jgi:hypothetical protein
VGYNFSAGKKLVLDITPILGGVFGRTTGIAPGCEASLTYRKVELSISNEYVFDTGNSSGSFYYSWPQVTYSPADWLPEHYQEGRMVFAEGGKTKINRELTSRYVLKTGTLQQQALQERGRRKS